MDELCNEILVELECPICSNYMLPPIRQCLVGHSICEQCRKKLTKCPSCTAAFVEGRNLSLETLSRKIRLPCINQCNGCKEVLSLDGRDVHERNCRFKSCKPINQNSIILSTNNYKMKTNTKFTESIGVSVDGEEFLFKCKSEWHGQIYWTVQYLGLPEDACNYYYEIELYKAFDSKRTIFRDYCQSIKVEDFKLFTKKYCITIMSKWITDYVEPDLSLKYCLNIFKGATGNCKSYREKDEVVLPTPRKRCS